MVYSLGVWPFDTTLLVPRKIAQERCNVIFFIGKRFKEK